MTAADLLTAAKLVIWDLDGTLWTGTLDSGDELSPTGLHEWIEPLARAGVMNSICSNNDLETARTALARLGVWDYVVFPKASWAPKAEMLLELVADVRLRPEDIVYVDDRKRFRQLAADEFGCMAIDPAVIGPYDARLARVPASDRLQHYRTLERRTADKQTVEASDGEGFLQRSGVTVTITPASDVVTRVAALSQRSNQLNFTDSRLDEADVRALVSSPDVQTGAVWVRDKYGDYGLSGFFARSAQSLDHFFFSCRVLHLGVESFVHEILGRPEVAGASDRVRRDRWSQLLADAPWVALGDAFDRLAPPRGQTLWVGGCDLQIVSGYLGRDADTDQWLLPTEQGGAQVYGRSSLLALLADLGDRVVLDRVPWMVGGSADLLSGTWDTLVLSPWVDCASWTYSHRATGLRIPSFVALSDDSTEWEWQHWWGQNPGRDAFLAEFELDRPLRPGEITTLLARLASRVAGRKIVVLTVPEIESRRAYPWGEPQLDRHHSFNVALERAAGRAGNIELLDVRDHVAGQGDLHDADDPVPFHFRRECYLRLARVAEARLADEAGPV